MLFSGFWLNSQSSLQVSINRFGTTKIFEVFTYENLEYKLKGNWFYRKDRIANMRDSIIVFANDSVIFLNQIKSIRLRKNVPHLAELAFVINGLGIGFFGLNTFNNAITDSPPIIIDGVAICVSGGLFTLAYLVKQLGIKRVRITGNKTLRIVEMNYNDLNKKN
jgi:hypothetical protein